MLIGGSSSELIHRFTQHAVRSGARVQLPQHHYGDYLQAAQVWGWRRSPPAPGRRACTGPASPPARWGCWKRSGPTGRSRRPRQEWRVLDCAYRPLWLEGTAPQRDLDTVWQLWTPNKALGMTGVRAAYAIAPLHAAAQELQALHRWRPGVGAHGVAMLQAWVTPPVQQWLAQSLMTCAPGSAAAGAVRELGWQVFPATRPITWSHACRCRRRTWGAAWRPCGPGHQAARLCQLGLPGHVRLGVLPPASQAALAQAWNLLEN
jgi:histidinol-phosphate aminotransferase